MLPDEGLFEFLGAEADKQEANVRRGDPKRTEGKEGKQAKPGHDLSGIEDPERKWAH